MLDKLAEKGVGRKDGKATRKNQLFTGTGEGDVQFPVDDTPVFHEAIACKEIKLVAMGDSE